MSPVTRYYRREEAERFVDFFSAVFNHIHVNWDDERMAFTTPNFGDILVVGETPQHIIAERLSALVGGVHSQHVRTLRLAAVGKH